MGRHQLVLSVFLLTRGGVTWLLPFVVRLVFLADGMLLGKGGDKLSDVAMG